MIDDGQIVDSMKVIVGKADPSTQTPMLASTIYYATLNPYWHVRPELVRSLIARNVLDQGLGYLKRSGYQVMSGRRSRRQLARPDDGRLAGGRGRHATGPGASAARTGELDGPDQDRLSQHVRTSTCTTRP